jgi:hypothetical protein
MIGKEGGRRAICSTGGDYRIGGIGGRHGSGRGRIDDTDAERGGWVG